MLKITKITMVGLSPVHHADGLQIKRSCWRVVLLARRLIGDYSPVGAPSYSHKMVSVTTQIGCKVEMADGYIPNPLANAPPIRSTVTDGRFYRSAIATVFS